MLLFLCVCVCAKDKIENNRKNKWTPITLLFLLCTWRKIKKILTEEKPRIATKKETLIFIKINVESNQRAERKNHLFYLCDANKIQFSRLIDEHSSQLRNTTRGCQWRLNFRPIHFWWNIFHSLFLLQPNEDRIYCAVWQVTCWPVLIGADNCSDEENSLDANQLMFLFHCEWWSVFHSNFVMHFRI